MRYVSLYCFHRNFHGIGNIVVIESVPYVLKHLEFPGGDSWDAGSQLDHPSVDFEVNTNGYGSRFIHCGN